MAAAAAAAAARLETEAAENAGSAQSVKSAGKSTNNDSRNASCSALRTAYNDCFNRCTVAPVWRRRPWRLLLLFKCSIWIFAARWYTDKFLKGQWEKEECIVEWEAYRACLSKRLEDRNLSHLLKIENLMLASNPKQ